MKLFLQTLFIFIIGNATCVAQVGINTVTPDPSSLLDVVSSEKGILIPKVALLGKNDKTTIANPVKGLFVIASQNSGSGVNAIYAGRFYVFSGTHWDELLENNKNAIDFIYPRIAAVGRKTTITNCTNDPVNNPVNNKVFELDIVTNKDGNLLAASGAITASRKGYYGWSIQLEQIMNQNAYSPYLMPGTLSYEFRKGPAATPMSQMTTFTGSVYLNANETSLPFTWFLGLNNKCLATDQIGKQVVIWKYLGE